MYSSRIVCRKSLEINPFPRQLLNKKAPQVRGKGWRCTGYWRTAPDIRSKLTPSGLGYEAFGLCTSCPRQTKGNNYVCSSLNLSLVLGACQNTTGLRRITSCLFPCRGKLVPVTASGELWRRIGQFQCLLCVVAGAELRHVYHLRGLVADGDWIPSRQSALAFTTNSF